MKEVRQMTDGERLVLMEQKIETVVTGIDKLSENFDNFTNTFVPRKELELMLQQRDKEIKNLQEDIDEIEENKWSIRRLWPAWVGVVLSGASIVTVLVTKL